MNGPHEYRACPQCGVAVKSAQLKDDGHACAPERFITHQTLKARAGLERLEEDLASWLATPKGAFQAFLARRMMV